MLIIARVADESVRVGERLTVTVTDVDPGGVRLLVDGELIGGPDDGQRVREARELAPGGEVRLGGLVTIVLVDVVGPKARLGFLVPRHVELHRAEVYDEHKRRQREQREKWDAGPE